MILVANRIHVADAHRDAFESMLETRVALVDSMPGFVAIHLLRPTAAGQPYVILTQWRSRSSFEAWTHSEEFRRGHARIGTLPAGTFTQHPHLEIHEVFHSAPPSEAAGHGASA
ncbi:antibiotic biosynthesis monooxygenase [bacterium]|nr:antibiotic biosynthesis monooxygenase [bacterium]